MPDQLETTHHGSPELDEDARKLEALGGDAGPIFADLETTEPARLTPAWALSYDDACRLSRVFNEGANLARSQDCEINEWLKKLIVSVRNAD